MVQHRGHLFLDRQFHAGSTWHTGTYSGLTNFCFQIAGVDGDVGQQVDVCLDLLAVKRQHFKGYPDMGYLHGNQYRCAVSLQLVTRSCPAGIEFRRHEDGASIGVGEEVVAGISVEGEAVAGCPVEHCLSTGHRRRPGRSKVNIRHTRDDHLGLDLAMKILQISAQL